MREVLRGFENVFEVRVNYPRFGGRFRAQHASAPEGCEELKYYDLAGHVGCALKESWLVSPSVNHSIVGPAGVRKHVTNCFRAPPRVGLH
jgi:hypothetical protein